MKRMLALTMITFIAVALFVPSADAGVLSNAAKNLGRAALCPLKAVARTAVATVDTVTCKEPLAVLSVFNTGRQEAVDIVASLKNAVVNKKPIACEDVGKFNTDVTEAGLDWLVDGIVYGAATGIAVHNGHLSGIAHHVGKAAFTAAGIAIGCDLAPKLVE